MSGNQAKISIIVPARNEELFLPGCIKSVKLAAQHLNEAVEIIVVLNRCTDRTEQIARRLGCKIARDDSKNLAKIRNSGARAALGEILVTIDADSRMSINMLKSIVVKMEGEKSIGGGVMILPERISMGIIATFFALLPIAIFHRIAGGVFFCRRDDFWAIGGFNEEVLSAEDIEFAVRLKKFGRKRKRAFHVLFRDYIVTSCRKFDRFGDWYFFTHPRQMLKLLFGKDQALANKVWYDFER